MADKISRAKRSANMSRIRSRANRTTEWRLRAFLIRSGIRGWRVTPKDIAGRPDFVFVEKRIAVFVDGCFWHCCPKCGHTPASNVGYWAEKLRKNRERDKKTTQLLRRSGWRVLRFWECQLAKFPSRVLQRISKELEQNR